MFSNKAIAIRDSEIQDFIKEYKWNTDCILSPLHFVQKHRRWLRNNTFYTLNLDKFKYGYVTAGCTEAFHEVYKEPCYVLKGEYTYHRDSQMAIESPVQNIPIGSRLIISYPFAETGNPHRDWNSILEICAQRKIRVFVDACLAGVSIGKLDLHHPTITHIAFSFSKAFGTGFQRVGVVYTNREHTPASVRNTHLYINHMNVDLHMNLMKQFSSDYIVKKYSIKQLDICKKHSLIQSDCVLFGLENNVRKCISRELVV